MEHRTSRHSPRLFIGLSAAFLLGAIVACNFGVSAPGTETATATPPPSVTQPPAPTLPAPPPTTQATPPATAAGFDKWSLWTGGAQLRGANIWQRVVVPELDGPDFMGSGHVGPPYTQEDFDRLAALGANYVNISRAGLFTERPPYVLDTAVQDNLDRLLEMAGQADLFAVITFRTGPGRSDFTFYSDGAGVWFDADLLIGRCGATRRPRMPGSRCGATRPSATAITRSWSAMI